MRSVARITGMLLFVAVGLLNLAPGIAAPAAPAVAAVLTRAWTTRPPTSG
ncbi:hypothetical protein AB0H88_12010 [Nonomuraea sp. NPDC050680]